MEKEYTEKEELVDWLNNVDGIIADGTVEAPTLYKQIITDIKNFPAADVEKVRHGEWIMHTNSEGNLNHYECSECHMCQGHISNFCEECGAKMDGG